MKRNYFIVVLIMLIFYVISFLTNILGPLEPEIHKSFHLSLFMASLLPFAFFIAYGVMSIPAGTLVERFKEKTVIIAAFTLSCFAAFLFAIFPSFPVYVISLFLIGVGMAMLQVAINPLLRVAGGEENFAFCSVLGQLAFGLASFIGPAFIYTSLMKGLTTDGVNSGNAIVAFFAKLVPQNLEWVSMYWMFGIISLVMVVVIAVIKFPKVELKEDEKAGSWVINRELFKNKYVILFFFGIFAYVGSEQGVSYWMSHFLEKYHGFDSQTVGAKAVGYFWAFLTAGCVLGLVFLKIWDSRKILKWFTAAAAITLLLALIGNARMALYGFPMVGFFLSVMWSVVFSLALNSVKKHHGAFSGILCTGIMGGAVVQLIVGALGDALGLRVGMMFIFITLAYIFSIGFWAKPLINNVTISSKN